MSGVPDSGGCRRLDDTERVDWLRLSRSERIGPRTFAGLLGRFGSAARALEALPDLTRRRGQPVRIASRADAERELAEVKRCGARLIALCEPDYPEPLRAIDSPPPLIAVAGDAALLARPAAAIVGSRNASAAGLRFAAMLAAALGEAGYVVVSGLARGIDSAAHRASLASGTVAVLAGGLDRPYPPENRALFADIAGAGVAVSEMPMGWVPRGRDFPRRNRLISGLSLAVVVVEAARRSGSLITARFALEQGREVLAVPGSPLDLRAEGTNDLIRAGATLCAHPDHVLEALQPLLKRLPPAGDAWLPGLVEAGLVEAGLAEAGRSVPDEDVLWDELDARVPVGGLVGDRPDIRDGIDADHERQTDCERVLALLGPAPALIDDLVRYSGLSAGDVQAALIELELGGRIRRQGSSVSLVPRIHNPR